MKLKEDSDYHLSSLLNYLESLEGSLDDDEIQINDAPKTLASASAYCKKLKAQKNTIKEASTNKRMNLLNVIDCGEGNKKWIWDEWEEEEVKKVPPKQPSAEGITSVVINIQKTTSSISNKIEAMKKEVVHVAAEESKLKSMLLKERELCRQKMKRIKECWEKRILDAEANRCQNEKRQAEFIERAKSDCDEILKGKRKLEIEINDVRAKNEHRLSKTKVDCEKRIANVRNELDQAEKDRLERMLNERIIDIKKNIAKSLEPEILALVRNNESDVKLLQDRQNAEIDKQKETMKGAIDEALANEKVRILVEAQSKCDQVRAEESAFIKQLDNDEATEVKILESDHNKVVKEYEQYFLSKREEIIISFAGEKQKLEVENQKSFQKENYSEGLNHYMDAKESSFENTEAHLFEEYKSKRLVFESKVKQELQQRLTNNIEVLRNELQFDVKKARSKLQGEVKSFLYSMEKVAESKKDNCQKELGNDLEILKSELMGSKKELSKAVVTEDNLIRENKTVESLQAKLEKENESLESKIEEEQSKLLQLEENLIKHVRVYEVKLQDDENEILIKSKNIESNVDLLQQKFEGIDFVHKQAKNDIESKNEKEIKSISKKIEFILNKNSTAIAEAKKELRDKSELRNSLNKILDEKRRSDVFIDIDHSK